jgi:hypothetical protein
MHGLIIYDMIGKYNATDIEVMDFATFVGCYMWQSGWDWSTVAFEMCNTNVLMKKALICKEGLNYHPNPNDSDFIE